MSDCDELNEIMDSVIDSVKEKLEAGIESKNAEIQKIKAYISDMVTKAEKAISYGSDEDNRKLLGMIRACELIQKYITAIEEGHV